MGRVAATVTLVPAFGPVWFDLRVTTVTWTAAWGVRGISELVVTVTTVLGGVLTGLGVVGSDRLVLGCGVEAGGEWGIRFGRYWGG